METTKKTVLHDFHCQEGAHMALFGNYDMPLWYKTGAKAEHLVVIGTAGIFDTSHMAVITLKGSGARALLQHCLTKDMDSCIGMSKGPLVQGRCVYGLFLDADGFVIDDAIVYHLGDESFMVVVNAGMGGVIAKHLGEQCQDQSVEIVDRTDLVGKMDIQGPDSAKVLAKIVKDPQQLFTKMMYFSFKGGFAGCSGGTTVQLLDGTDVMVSRTGYTGEFGFELFCDVKHLCSLWNQLLEAGKDFSVIPCGLASRDSLRAGAVLPLSHQDIGGWPFANTPWGFAVPEKDGNGNYKKEFYGAKALAASNWQKHTLAFAGFDPRKIGAEEANYVTDVNGEKIGKILTCTTDMAIGRVDGEIKSIAGDKELKLKGLCCGFVLLDRNVKQGEVVFLSDGKRKIKVEIRADIRPLRTARSAMGTMVG
ncbi:MAG: glycine cleavage system protein T [Desulfotalea sp.]|nr:MAG: glycine cleavage system protein T [Desulfotalea sp.]